MRFFTKQGRALSLAVAAVFIGAFLFGCALTIPKKEKFEWNLSLEEKDFLLVLRTESKADSAVRAAGPVLTTTISKYKDEFERCGDYMELNHCQDVREVLGLLYYYTGNMYFDDQDYRSAGMYYSGVWTLRSIGVRDLYYGRGNAYISNGDYDKAIEFFSLSEGNRDERTYQALAKAKELKRDAEEAAKRAVEQAEEAAKQAAKEAAQAALDATPPVPVGTGYDRVPWGASIESVKNIYQDSQLKTGTEGVELIQKNVGGGISNRTFGFIQDKLIVVREVYEKTNEQGADLVVKKLTATYGKPKETASETDRYTGIDMTVSIWEYNKKTEITLTKLGTASRAKQNQQKLELVRQLGGQFGAAMAQQVEVLADPSKALCDFWIDYKDMAGFERIRKEKK